MYKKETLGEKDMNIMDEKAASYLRYYDNTKASFIFLDEEYSILPIIKETDEIYNKNTKY